MAYSLLDIEPGIIYPDGLVTRKVLIKSELDELPGKRDKGKFTVIEDNKLMVLTKFLNDLGYNIKVEKTPLSKASMVYDRPLHGQQLSVRIDYMCRVSKKA